MTDKEWRKVEKNVEKLRNRYSNLSSYTKLNEPSFNRRVITRTIDNLLPTTQKKDMKEKKPDSRSKSPTRSSSRNTIVRNETFSQDDFIAQLGEIANLNLKDVDFSTNIRRVNTEVLKAALLEAIVVTEPIVTKGYYLQNNKKSNRPSSSRGSVPNSLNGSVTRTNKTRTNGPANNRSNSPRANQSSTQPCNSRQKLGRMPDTSMPMNVISTNRTQILRERQVLMRNFSNTRPFDMSPKPRKYFQRPSSMGSEKRTRTDTKLRSKSNHNCFDALSSKLGKIRENFSYYNISKSPPNEIDASPMFAEGDDECDKENKPSANNLASKLSSKSIAVRSAQSLSEMIEKLLSQDREEMNEEQIEVNINEEDAKDEVKDTKLDDNPKKESCKRDKEEPKKDGSRKDDCRSVKSHMKTSTSYNKEEIKPVKRKESRANSDMDDNTTLAANRKRKQSKSKLTNSSRAELRCSREKSSDKPNKTEKQAPVSGEKKSKTVQKVYSVTFVPDVKSPNLSLINIYEPDRLQSTSFELHQPKPYSVEEFDYSLSKMSSQFLQDRRTVSTYVGTDRPIPDVIDRSAQTSGYCFIFEKMLDEEVRNETSEDVSGDDGIAKSENKMFDSQLLNTKLGMDKYWCCRMLTKNENRIYPEKLYYWLCLNEKAVNDNFYRPNFEITKHLSTNLTNILKPSIEFNILEKELELLHLSANSRLSQFSVNTTISLSMISTGNHSNQLVKKNSAELLEEQLETLERMGFELPLFSNLDVEVGDLFYESDDLKSIPSLKDIHLNFNRILQKSNTDLANISWSIL